MIGCMELTWSPCVTSYSARWGLSWRRRPGNFLSVFRARPVSVKSRRLLILVQVVPAMKRLAPEVHIRGMEAVVVEVFHCPSMLLVTTCPNHHHHHLQTIQPQRIKSERQRTMSPIIHLRPRGTSTRGHIAVRTPMLIQEFGAIVFPLLARLVDIPDQRFQ